MQKQRRKRPGREQDKSSDNEPSTASIEACEDRCEQYHGTSGTEEDEAASEDIKMRGSGRGQPYTGVSWRSNQVQRGGYSRSTGQGYRGGGGAHHAPAGVSVGPADLDEQGANRSMLGHRSRGRGRSNGRGRGSYPIAPGCGRQGRAQLTNRREALAQSTAAANKVKNVVTATASAPKVVMVGTARVTVPTAADALAAKTTMAAAESATHPPLSSSDVNAAVPQAGKPFVGNEATIAASTAYGAALLVAPVVTDAAAHLAAGGSVSNEQTRRARRARRAIMIFQEQRQQQQAEAVARQELVQASGVLSSSSSTAVTSDASSSSASSFSVPPLSRLQTSCKAKVGRSTAGTKGIVVNNSTYSSPTHFSASAPTTDNSATENSATATIIDKFTQSPSNTSPATTTAQASLAAPAAPEFCTHADDCQTDCAATDRAAGSNTMANFKMDGGLLGSDPDEGNESDEMAGDFIMTRTAGKRRGNLSAADMLANEILDDINEDLNAVTEDDEECDPVKRMHRGYMNEAVAMAQLALRTNETPVGCVLVHNGRIIASGMNATNMTRNGTRHAELMCLNALFSHWDDVNKSEHGSNYGDDDSDCGSAEDYDDDKKEYTDEDWEKVDPSKGHLYPYGQKLHPARIVNQDIVRECSLYVTVEPCIMCASMLRQYGIKKVYFGAANDKFGGTGGVLRIHMNSKPNPPAPENATYIETYVTNMLSKPRRSRIIRGPPDTAADGAASTQDTPVSGGTVSASSPLAETAELPAEAASATVTTNYTTTIVSSNTNPPVVRRASTIPIAEGSVPARDEGHGGNVEPGFDVEGGWGRNKAVFLLRQFYVQENGRAPAPRKKEGRAQRLVQQMKSESGSTIKLPSSADGHLADIEAELDSLPLAAVKPTTNELQDSITSSVLATTDISNASDD